MCIRDSRNTLVVKVDSRESVNIPPFGFVIDYMTYGGLYREVWLLSLIHICIDVPVVAGIMPVTNKAQIKRIVSLSGNMVPPRFLAIVDRFGDNPAAMRQAGIAYATDQIIDLIANGVNHVHIYTMNKPDVAGEILDNLSEIYVRA